MQFAVFGKVLMALGAMIFVLGAVLFFGVRFGLGHLPGDMAWQRGNWSFQAPLVTCIVLSIVLTIVVNLLLRFLK